jgi:uncharacterized membrane protein
MADKEKGASRARPSRRRRSNEHEPDGSNPAATLTDTAEETAGGARDTAEETAGGARDTAEQTAGGARDTAEETAGQLTSGTQSLTAELRSTIRDAAIDVLRPVAKEATTAAAKYAVKKGPEFVKGTIQPKVEGAGGPMALAQGALSKAGEAGGGLLSKIKRSGEDGGARAPQGTGRGRRLPVQEYVDVAVPVETAYNQFTQFEEFPRFMHRVEKVEQRDDTTLVWHENIWGIRRQWEAEIVEQVPDERIVWRSRGGVQTTGVVTFHRLSDRLTRVYLNVDFQPKGLFEKTASGFRLSRKAIKSDLMRFKAYVEMRDEETGAWRERIEEGEVVEQGREGGPQRDEAQAEAEPEAEAEEEPEAEGEEEPEAEGEDEYDEEEYEEEETEEEEEEPQAAAEEEGEEEEEKAPRKPARRRPATRPPSRSRR